MCLEWLRDNGLGEEAVGCEITSEMRLECIARVRSQHAHIMRTITGRVPPAPLRQLLQDSLRQVLGESFTPVGGWRRGHQRQLAPPQARAQRMRQKHASSEPSARMQSMKSGQEAARLRSNGRVVGSQRGARLSGSGAPAAHPLSPVQRPRAHGQAAYVTLRGRVIPPPASPSLEGGAPMPPVA